MGRQVDSRIKDIRSGLANNIEACRLIKLDQILKLVRKEEFKGEGYTSL